MRAWLKPIGVHIPHDKGATQALATRDTKPPVSVVQLMNQHIGTPCVPCVVKGQHVLRGQKIGEAQGMLSSPVHASVSGTVEAVELRPWPGGEAVVAVIIVNDGAEKCADPLPPLSLDSTKEELLARIRECGIVGMGGAAFPTHVKLNPPPDKKIDTLLINGAECEPFITADHRLMLERSTAIAEGARIAMRILGVRRAILGIEANKLDAVTRMRGVAGEIELRVLPARYPQGGEKILMQAILGREVPSGGLPADAGCVVLNVGTCAAIADAALRGLPLTERILTVTGPCVATPANLRVRLGTRLRTLIEECGGYLPEQAEMRRLLTGGPMMGQLQPTDEVPCVKGTTGVVSMHPAVTVPARNCISCGRCHSGCPAGLMSMRISTACRRGDLALAERLGVLDCMECGSCTFTCPSKIDVLTPIRVGKRALLKARRREGGKA